MEQTASPESAAAEYAGFTKTQKLAAFLLLLSPENAAQIMKSLEEQDLADVSAEMVKLEMISQGMQSEILREFSGVAVDAVTAIKGGMDRAKGLLEKSVGSTRASDLIGRLSPQRTPIEAMQQIVDMDARHIFSLLRQEQMQTVVLVMSYLSQDKASQLLTMFRPEQRDQIVERLATMVPTSVEVVGQVAEALQSKFGNNRGRTYNQTGGVRMAAQVLNSLPPNVSKSILMSVTERNADLGDSILKKMFTFEELEKLDTRTLQTILQNVETRDLAIALKSASDKLKRSLLAGLSKRAADNINEEISFMGPLKLTEIDAARGKILETVRQLETDGEISLESIRQRPRQT
jgi:flagellar motor switch protein FliG